MCDGVHMSDKLTKNELQNQEESENILMEKRGICEHILICLHFISEHMRTFTDVLPNSDKLFDILSVHVQSKN